MVDSAHMGEHRRFEMCFGQFFQFFIFIEMIGDGDDGMYIWGFVAISFMHLALTNDADGLMETANWKKERKWE